MLHAVLAILEGGVFFHLAEKKRESKILTCRKPKAMADAGHLDTIWVVSLN